MNPSLGHPAWHDLTVEQAEMVRDFYSAVCGWAPQPVAMGDYDDFSMVAPDGATVAGICHARGENLGLPPQWLTYFVVPNLDVALAEVRDRGGLIIQGPREMGSSRYVCIQDPAGAVCMLWQAATD